MTEVTTSQPGGAVDVDDDYEAVRVVGLSKTFKVRSRSSVQHVHAVRDVSFRVTRGSALGIAGESGSGKSTVARMMVGLEVPSDGEIWIGGARLPEPPSTSDRRTHARRIQMVFQDPYSSLDPRQPISAALDEVQRVHFQRSPRERRARTLQLLDAVGLGERYVEALPRALSGGQRQRLVIARSLAAEPAVLVLDEAVSALDVSTQAQILNLLRDLQAEYGLTYIFISHDLAVIRQICDDVLVLYRGELMEHAPAEQLLTRPRHPYTKLLLDSVPRQGMELEKRPERGTLNDAGCLFASRCPHAHDRCSAEPPEFSEPSGGRSRCWLAADAPSTSPLLDHRAAHHKGGPDDDR
ncbi:MAG TPA: oligopeptide/dipeptide ABC transporter ATP-binding protein [Mycobacteriales bacterium]|nr:oligopeptide/dipeptide ABC transporter ATP-binding protein [Mycobacteriales bacterium]